MNYLYLSLTLGLALTAGIASADNIDITTMNYSGPYMIKAPFQTDSIDANSKKFDVASILNTPVTLSANRESRILTPATIPASSGTSLHMLDFRVDNNHYFEGTLKVEGPEKYTVYVDGKKIESNKLVLTPATHKIIIKCLTIDNPSLPVTVKINGDNTDNLRVNQTGDRLYTLRDVMEGRHYYNATPSPSGKYILTTYYETHDGGSVTYNSYVTDFNTGRQISSYSGWLNWLPKSDMLYKTVQAGNDTRLVSIDPVNGKETVMVSKLPSRQFTLSPNADYLIYTANQDLPKEKSQDLYEILHPEDRQPGWRQRGQIMKYDFATGVSTPLTFGNRKTYLYDISDDGNKLLIGVLETDVEQRPSTLVSTYIMDLTSGKTTPVFEKQGFIGSLKFSPDASKIAVTATPEAFDGIGKNLPEGRTPSMADNQLYVIDVKSGKVTPLTREFNPSVEGFDWNYNDGMVYFKAWNGDHTDLFRVDTSTGKIENLNVREENVSGFAFSRNAPVGVYYGQGASNSERLYSIDTKKTSRHKLIDDLSAERLAGIKLGNVSGWKFLNTRGDSISCYYVLPPDFDPSVKYPMIVNYYGGCNPTIRTLESRYPHQVYAAHGYVVLVVNPSGAAGFGQEFASRHVNTAGDGVAEDIIEAVKNFTASHPWVNASKIGCIGASYGGFMTQYLQTKTDIFAAAISHAGISGHSSYWGVGYWGYSYSEVCMANSYPWSHQDLYVKQSPLYNADKIHTPLLFLHGDKDTNVPFSESIQMFTALKRLGRPTAFVAVKDTNHQVLDFNKRLQWQETIFAWFAKYLQDDPSWWERLYPAKPLN